MQTELIDKVLKASYWNGGDCNAKPTPTFTTPLGSDACRWTKMPIVMGLGLSDWNAHVPDFKQSARFVVHQCARFTHNPRTSHGQAVLQICCYYLKGTWDKGLVFRHNATLALDCYVDAYFAGLWKVENESHPVHVKLTGYVFLLGGCPLTWASRLQTEIALSTVEAEYIALSMAMRDLLPGRALLKVIGAMFQLSFCKEFVILKKV